MPDAASLRGIEHADGFRGVAAERPLAIDVLPRLDRRHYRPIMIGHLDADRDQIDVRMLAPMSRGRRRRAAPRNAAPRLPRFPAGSCRPPRSRTAAARAMPGYGQSRRTRGWRWLRQYRPESCPRLPLAPPANADLPATRHMPRRIGQQIVRRCRRGATPPRRPRRGRASRPAPRRCARRAAAPI